MKKYITLLLILSTGTAFGQKATKIDSTSFFFGNGGTAYFTESNQSISKYNNGFEWSATVIKDTMTIEAPKVKYLKIDGVLFEVVRKTELKQYEGGSALYYFQSNGSPYLNLKP